MVVRKAAMRSAGYSVREKDPFARRVELHLPHWRLVSGTVRPGCGGGDRTGRLGRFLMNLMLAAGGYPWTIIPVQERDAYMTALEDTSVRGDILPFTHFLARLVERDTTDSGSIQHDFH